MASSYTTNVRLEKPEQGVTQTWGTRANTVFDICDASIAGLTTINTTGGTTTLTNTDATVTDAKYAILRVTGATTTSAVIQVPTISGFSKTYYVLNETTEGGSSTTLTINTSGHSGVVIPRSCAAAVLVRNIGGTHEVSFIGPIVVRSTGAPNSGSGTVASSVEVSPTGNLSSVTAQAAFAELQGDIDTINTSLTNKQALDTQLTTISGLATTKGNLMVGNSGGTDWTALGVGSNYTLLAADSSASSGTAWTALGTIVTNQTAETTVALADTVPIYDASAAAGRKMTVENILKAINLATEDTTPDSSADFVLTYDVSASGIKKAKPGNFTTASDTAKGLIEVAIQSEMETGSSTTLAVTPGRQIYHPAHPKAWIIFVTTGGTSVITTDYGVASVSDHATGNYTVNFDTAFSGATAYGCTGSWGRSAGSTGIMVTSFSADTKSTTAFEFRMVNDAGTDVNPPEVGVIFTGDV
jgi:hypothetical protein